jgi:hypothetical protein
MTVRSIVKTTMEVRLHPNQTGKLEQDVQEEEEERETVEEAAKELAVELEMVEVKEVEVDEVEEQDVEVEETENAIEEEDKDEEKNADDESDDESAGWHAVEQADPALRVLGQQQEEEGDMQGNQDLHPLSSVAGSGKNQLVM